MIDAPRLTRPAFVSLMAGGKQDFPNDPVMIAKLERQRIERNRKLREAGKRVFVRRES